MSCASWIGRTLLFRVAIGTKLLGVSSNHDIKIILKEKSFSCLELKRSKWAQKQLCEVNIIYCGEFDLCWIKPFLSWIIIGSLFYSAKSEVLVIPELYNVQNHHGHHLLFVAQLSWKYTCKSNIIQGLSQSKS